MSNIIPLIPQDWTGFPDLGIPRPEVAPQHTEHHCTRCQRPCWIGEQQFQAAKRGFADPICYFCFVDDLRRGKLDVRDMNIVDAKDAR